MGIDLSQYDLDEPVGNVKSNAIQSVIANFAESARNGQEFTVRDIAERGAIGGLGPLIVGSGEEIADTLQEWVEETDVDGFNLAYAITPGTFEDVVEHVIPVLRARGVYPDDVRTRERCARSSTAAATACPTSTAAPATASARGSARGPERGAGPPESVLGQASDLTPN